MAVASNTSGTSSNTEPEQEKSYGWRSDTNGLFEPVKIAPQRDQPKMIDENEGVNDLTKTRTMTLLGGMIKLRAKDDDEPSDWWFANQAIPLLSATFAPMANMLSIAALVVYWRNRVTTPDEPSTKFTLSVGYPDPKWCLDLNGASLACGFMGNFFLLCNFTRKVRYIIALPVTIFLFYISAAILIGITAGMSIYDPPKEDEVYSQGFWYAVIAACLYMGNAMLLMVNMLGYFLGHYPQHFDLTDEQRNLILQTMIFFFWLAGGAGVFAALDDWPGTYTDALYFCDVTLLTVGFGDFTATDDVGRGLVFPYTVGGTIILGLMVSSIHKFAKELSKDKVVKRHIENARVNTLRRAVTSPEDHSATVKPKSSETPPAISRPWEGEKIQHRLDEQAELNAVRGPSIDFNVPQKQDFASSQTEPASKSIFRTLTRRVPVLVPTRSQKAILMRHEKDRFDSMRAIQLAAKRFKAWYALGMSVLSFGLLWCVGAVVFWQVESETQGLSYFEALYFCYVSLLTIGYGDLSPRSNAGKPFFVFWSLIAVPTMTILISDLGDTAISSFKQRVLEYGGLAFLGKGRGWGLDWFSKQKEGLQKRLSIVGLHHEKAPVLEKGVADDRPSRLQQEQNESKEDFDKSRPPLTIDELAFEDLSETEMTRRLAFALQRVANDRKEEEPKRYSYEEWVEFTRLIRFSRLDTLRDVDDPSKQLEYDEAVDGLIEWDWLDANSPMTSEQSESEWVMDRLLESLLRTFRKSDILTRLAEADQTIECGIEPHSGFRLRRRNRTQGVNEMQTATQQRPNDDTAQWSKRGKARLHQDMRRSSSSARRPAPGPHD